jgi:hypothetical protein
MSQSYDAYLHSFLLLIVRYSRSSLQRHGDARNRQSNSQWRLTVKSRANLRLVAVIGDPFEGLALLDS